MRQRMSVLLPEPFGPSRAETSPCPTVNDTSSTARTAPQTLLSCSTWIRRGSVPLPVLRLAALPRSRMDDLVRHDHERTEQDDDDDGLPQSDLLEIVHHAQSSP